MQRVVLYLLLLLAGSACQKEKGKADPKNPDPTVSYNGAVTAILDGEPWEALAKWRWYDQNNKQIEIVTKAWNEKDWEEYLTFSMIPLEIGRFSLHDCYTADSSLYMYYPSPHRSAGYSLLDGDVMYASYCTIDSVRSFIEIKSISPDSTRLTGVFEIVMTESLTPDPDILYFTQGTFEVGPEKK